MPKTNDYKVIYDLPTIPPSDTGLYWSEDGRINCAQHAPLYLSDTWRMERWVPLTRADLKVFTFKACCETCKRVPP